MENPGTGPRSEKKPLVSFVIPAFNAECFIAKSIRSCLAQTLENIEVIIVDDGSVDGTRAVVEYLAKTDSRIRYNALGVNHGRSIARNIGNRLAQADIICVQDADDESLPKRALITLDYFNNHPDVGMFYGGFSICDVYSKIIQQIVPIAFDYERVKSGKAMETGIGHGTMAYRKETALQFPYDEKGDFSKLGLDDWKLQLDMFKGGVKFAYTLQPLFLYRYLVDTITNTRDMSEVLKVKREFLNESVAA